MADRYQVASKANMSFMDKVSVGALKVDVPYLVMKMVKGTHPEYKESIKVVLRDSNRVQYFSYLPPRFARKFSQSHVDGFSKDIAEKKPPFIIYRGMVGKGFDVDIHPFDLEVATKALKGQPHPRQTKSPEKSYETNENEEVVKDDMSWLEEMVDGGSSTQS